MKSEAQITEDMHIGGEQKVAAALYAKGYRYRIHIVENGVDVPPLYIKNASDAGPLMRQSYPHGTIRLVDVVYEDGCYRRATDEFTSMLQDT